MENLSPPLTVLLEVRWEMENGASFREALREYLRGGSRPDFADVLQEWMIRKSHGQDIRALRRAEVSPYRLAVLDLFDRGWNGEPILEAVEELEGEIEAASQAELDHFVATLSFRAMLPLLLLQFPAYLLLLTGPLLTELLRAMGPR